MHLGLRLPCLIRLRCRNDRIQAQADRLTKMMAVGSKAIQQTQGRIDDDNRRIAEHAERKEREIRAAAEAKERLLEKRRQEMVASLNSQLEAQEQRRQKEVEDQRRVAAQYRAEAERFRQEEDHLYSQQQKKKDAYRVALQKQKEAVERHRQQQMLAMDQRERSLNKALLEEVRHFLQL